MTLKLNQKQSNRIKLSFVLILIGSICVMGGFSALNSYTFYKIIIVVGIICNLVGVLVSTSIMANSITRCNNEKTKIK